MLERLGELALLGLLLDLVGDLLDVGLRELRDIAERSPAYSRTSDSYAPNLATMSHSCRSDIVPDSTWRQAEVVVVVVSREE